LHGSNDGSSTSVIKFWTLSPAEKKTIIWIIGALNKAHKRIILIEPVFRNPVEE
jgi:hypothetical protein